MHQQLEGGVTGVGKGWVGFGWVGLGWGREGEGMGFHWRRRRPPCQKHICKSLEDQFVGVATKAGKREEAREICCRL